MKKNPRFSFLIFLVLVSLVLGACGGGAEVGEGTEPPDVVDTTEPGPRKIATFIWTQEPDNLNPMYTSMWFSVITQQIWTCDPWVFDDNDAPVPVLITEMPSIDNGGLSADGKTITLTLRDDIVWSDGEPITSADFVFTWEMFNAPSNTVNSTYPYDEITSMDAPDAQTVVMTFDAPFIPWAGALGQEILPKHVLEPVFDAEGSLDEAAWNEAPTVGCGPFVFSEWESGSYARFVRNDNYYDTLPLLDEIFIRFVPDDASQVAALLSGDGDLGTFISYSDIPTLEDAGVNVIAVASGYNEGWYPYFGPEANPAIQDLKVRQAIAMCVDRFSLVNDLLLGMTEPAASFWHNTPWQDPDLEPWPYDPVQANALLDDAGWIDSNDDGVRDKDGVELVLVHGTTTREVRADTQAVAQQDLAQCGIQLDIVGYASDVFFLSYGEGGPCDTGELDICEWSGTVDYPDPNTARFLCREVPSDEFPDGSNGPHLCDPDLDALFELQATQIDLGERQATFHEISRYMTENVYWLGMWYDPDIWAVSGDLTNVRISGATPFFNIAEWDLTE
jgi:peptide/nickel transport system substrate-binding protein